MSENERKTVRSGGLQHLNNTQRAFVIFHLAEGQKVREFLPYFLAHFPAFGEGLDEKRLKRLLSERFRKIRGSQKERIDALREIKERDIGHPDFWMFPAYLYQQLWWQAPRIILKKTGIDKNGRPYEIYQFATKTLLKILQGARDAAEGVVDTIPITRTSFRLQCLQELYEDIPRFFLKKVVEKNGKSYKVYESQARGHFAILNSGRKELTDTDAALTSIAHPFYRLRCLQRLWTRTLVLLLQKLKKRSAETPIHLYNLTHPENLLTQILDVAEIESQLLHTFSRLPTPEEIEQVPIALSERRAFLHSYLFEKIQSYGAERLD